VRGAARLSVDSASSPAHRFSTASPFDVSRTAKPRGSMNRSMSSRGRAFPTFRSYAL